jgi:hypothetical protein
METRIKNAAGAVMLLSGFPAVAQEAAALKATTCPPCPVCVVTPPDPISYALKLSTVLVATLVVGIVLGFVAAKLALARRDQQR